MEVEKYENQKFGEFIDNNLKGFLCASVPKKEIAVIPAF
jgi:hypothetical protein